MTQFDPNMGARDDLGAQLAKSVLRHVFTGAAGALGTAGVLSSDQQTQFIAIGSAIALYGIGQAWSFVRKFTAAKR